MGGRAGAEGGGPIERKTLAFHDSMKVLDLESKGLDILPPIPENITHLKCGDNNLTELPELPEDLVSLDCNENELTELPELPDIMEELNCAYNKITVLPHLPYFLKTLQCESNKLTEMPYLHPNLTMLICGSNKLDNIPTLPDYLITFECASNKLTELPDLPYLLKTVVCFTNLLTALPELPDNLINLECADNKLTELPTLNHKLRYLVCGKNELTVIPTLPESLLVLDCPDNKLTTLPEIPDKMEIIRCERNPFIEPFKTIVAGYYSGDDKGDIKVLRKKVNKALGSVTTWNGFTQSDIGKLDIIFEEQASEYAMCPVCTRYVERSEACMYMKHNCAETPGFYHRALYNKFKNDEGYIGWCTICNRITKGHRHYELTSSTVKRMPELEPSGDPFEKDCSKTNHGGGLPEKLARFRRFREYALELQDDIDEKSEKEALEELVEETWNAPLRREKKLLKGIAETKKWNINTGRFSKNAVIASTNNVNTPNIPFDGKLPTEIAKGHNNIMFNDDVPILRFHHKQADGTMETHGIAKETLEELIKDKTKDFGTQSFGLCFMYPGSCDSRLHPAEIKGHVPAELYEKYQKNFNKKFKATRGGGSLLTEATDAVCIVVKRSGTRKVKGAKNRKRTVKRR